MLPIYLSMLDGDDEKSKFESLYLTYRKLMFHVANGILNDEGLAEDAVHQAFLKILENFDKVGEISCHKTRSYVVICFITRIHAIQKYDIMVLEGTSMNNSYTYYACVPIGKTAIETTCLVRHRTGVFEEYQNGKWIEAPHFFSILVGENDDFEEVSEKIAEIIIQKLTF